MAKRRCKYRPCNGVACRQHGELSVSTVSQQLPTIASDDYSLSAIRASGPGGQHVNTTSSAVQLRFDIAASSLPEPVKQRLLALSDHRITRDGVVIITAREHRSQEQNKLAAVARLQQLVAQVWRRPRARRPTRATRASQERRLASKAKHGKAKARRQQRHHDD